MAWVLCVIQLCTRCVVLRINKFGYVIIPHSKSVLHLILLIFKNFAYKCTFQPNIFITVSFRVMSSSQSLGRQEGYTHTLRLHNIQSMCSASMAQYTVCYAHIQNWNAMGRQKLYDAIDNLFIVLRGKAGTTRIPFNIWHFCCNGKHTTQREKKCNCNLLQPISLIFFFSLFDVNIQIIVQLLVFHI